MARNRPRSLLFLSCFGAVCRVASMAEFSSYLFCRLELIDLPGKRVLLIQTCWVLKSNDAAFFQKLP